MFNTRLGYMLFVGLLASFPVPVRADDPGLKSVSAEQHLQRGQAAFTAGALPDAILEWRQASDITARTRDSENQVEALVRLATAYHWLGQARLSIDASEQAIRAAEQSDNPRSVLLAKSSLGIACTCGRQATWAEQNLREALELATQQNDRAAVAGIWNNLGNLLAENGKLREALGAYQESAALAEQTGRKLTQARALANAAAVAARDGRKAEAAKLDGESFELATKLTPSHEQSILLIRSGRTNIKLGDRDKARRGYRQALAAAESLGDQRAMTYALGYLGEIAESNGDFPQALELTRQAMVLAQQIPMPEALYQWERQSGRIRRAQGDNAAAIASYRRAVQTLQPLRSDLALGCGGAEGSFRETIGPVYWELADLLLQSVAAQNDSKQRAQTLREARDTVESLKSAELEDYLRDECAGMAQVQAAAVEEIAAHTAVIYIIPLPDRTDLLMSVGAGLEVFRSPATAKQLDDVVTLFRANLENRATSRYLKQAKQLSQWLIDPLRAALQSNQVNTLVFVPDGLLRTIPMAALHDGEKFLIEDYSIAVTPGLTLLAPRPMARQGLEVLVAGLSEPVDNRAPLPFAAEEVQHIHRLFRADSLLDERFVGTELRKDFAAHQYGIVHLATHGEFNKDASQSYIQMYDGKLTLSELADLLRPGKFRGKPVELLTLSACQTAAGDDRAALGLAGVAVKAGARSALATLWFVHDQSTALLMNGFYEELQQEPLRSKAHALQRAQLKLLHDPRYEHAGFWSPYLLIGNWL